MAEQYPALEQQHVDFICRQQLFFVGTAGGEGRVNVSPKGMDTFRVINAAEVMWLNLTGSGNETAAHVLENRRMTIMFCSFDRQPLIMRLYGDAEVIHPRDEQWAPSLALFPDDIGARQIFRLQVNLVQTSCGYAVPQYAFKGERPTLRKWAQKHGRYGIRQYWREKNLVSLDGRKTGIMPEVEAVDDAGGE